MARDYEQQLQKLREAEQDRFSRWFVDNAVGMLFADGTGKSWPVRQTEAQAIEAQARALLEDHIAWLRIMHARIAVASVLGYFAFAASMTQDDLSFRIAAGLAAALCGGYVGWCVWKDIGYVWRMQRWRARQGEELAARARVSVPREFASHDRRYDLYRAGMYACVLGVILHVAWSAVFHPGGLDHEAQTTALLVNGILVGLAWLFHYLAPKGRRAD